MWRQRWACYSSSRCCPLIRHQARPCRGLSTGTRRPCPQLILDHGFLVSLLPCFNPLNNFKAIIASADLETCTAKTVRKQLEADLKIDLESSKQQINEIINEAIMKRLAEQERQESKSQSEIDEPLDDETLARQLQAEENDRIRTPRRAAPKAKGKRLVRREPSGAPKTPNPNNPFNKPFLLSEPLSRLVGATELSRPQVVKHIWAYVKEHNLQDPSDKRILICDELMLPVMKKPKISCFAMNKMISDHLTRKEDALPAAKRTKISQDHVDE